MANNYLSKKIDLTTTDVTTLYTVPAETTGIVKSILVSNDSSNQSLKIDSDVKGFNNSTADS